MVQQQPLPGVQQVFGGDDFIVSFRVGAKVYIHMVVISCIIFMQRRSIVDGIEKEGVYP